MMYGGIEAGGTKFICAVAASPDRIEHRSAPIVVTDEKTGYIRTPSEVFQEVVAFFEPFRRDLRAFGVASFGPVDLQPDSPQFGYVTTTPKAKWGYTDMVSPLRAAFNLPMGFTHDVIGGALGEWGYGQWGKRDDQPAKKVDTLVYYTVGTGIGGAAIINGHPHHGIMHSEMGHILVRRHPGDTFLGVCPYHDDCLEGLATGPSLKARWGRGARELPDDHVGWQFEAYYLAQAVVTTILLLAPDRIVMGGGVMHKDFLFEMIRRETQRLLKGYVNVPAVTQHIETLIVPPSLGDDAGITGALELARLAAERGV